MAGAATKMAQDKPWRTESKWEEAGKWLINNHGATGIIIIGETAIIAGLVGAITYLFKKYMVAQAALMGQADKCRGCLQEMDSRHTAELDGFRCG